MVKSKVVFLINRPNSKKKTSKKSNPFDFHINKVKLKVLGQKLSSCQGLPEISRNKALLKRTKTLLQEYNMKDKNNQFIDKRIGERNSGLTEDDRIMARFTAERKRMFNKKTMFNLSHEVFLTHRGQTLSEIERFEDTKSEDEEEPEESGALRGKFVSSAHFGGGLLTKNKQDRKSLIDELIKESKKRKAERHCIKGEILEATKQLDEDWKSLVLIIPSKTKDLIDISSKEMVGFQKKDTYDVVMRQLKFESYGQASLRLPTDEEIAKEDKERLERLEKERLRLVREIELAKKDNHQSADDIIDDESTYRYVICDIMTDSDDEAEESESSSGSDVEIKDESNEESEPSSQYSTGNNNIERASFVEVQAKAKKGKKRKKNPSEKVQLKDEIGDAKKHEDETVNLREGLNVDEDHPTLSDSGSESSEDQGCAMDNLIDLMPPLHKNGVINELKTGNISTEIKHGSKSQIKWTKEDDCKTETPFQSDLHLPYVLNMPDSYKLFKDLLKNYFIEQHTVIFERLIKSNHPSLEPGNKKKMLNLVEYIIQYLSEGKVTWEALPAVALHLSTLKEFNNEECLKILVDNIVKKLNDFKSTFPSVANVKFLALYILLSLKPQGMEVLLPVTKPALSLACNVLSQTSFLSSNQITTALLCCYLLLQDAKKSSTVYTNAIIFLHNFVKITTSKSISGKVLCQNLSENKSESQPKCENLPSSTTGNLKICLSDKQDEVGLQTDDSQILYCSLVLMSGFVKVYKKYSESKILFNSIHCYLSQLNADSYPQSIKQEVVELQTLLKVLQTSKLPPLFNATQKPKALCLYTPSFHTVTVGKSHRVLPPEQFQEQKLLHKYKQEMKGAMRELRRDRVFLANVKLSEQARRDEMRMKKVKEIFGTAAEQQGELQKFKYKK